jgi:hypothetical protein
MHYPCSCVRVFARIGRHHNDKWLVFHAMPLNPNPVFPELAAVNVEAANKAFRQAVEGMSHTGGEEMLPPEVSG